MEPNKCPRCGEVPEIFDRTFKTQHSWSVVHRCGANPQFQIDSFYGTKTRDEAVADWNGWLEAMKK